MTYNAKIKSTSSVKVGLVENNILNVKVDLNNNRKTTFEDLNVYQVDTQSNSQIKTSFAYTLDIMPQNLDELNDVEISEVNGAQDKYVLVYNASTQTWQAVNPDVILSSAATEPIQPGLPNDFIGEISDHDVDGGEFS